ncbi:MAG: hypothetical protein CVV27_01180, partial [Candidatus Melainabacteria bacterium HGW-Melainabacteria-1]
PGGGGGGEDDCPDRELITPDQLQELNGLMGSATSQSQSSKFSVKQSHSANNFSIPADSSALNALIAEFVGYYQGFGVKLQVPRQTPVDLKDLERLSDEYSSSLDAYLQETTTSATFESGQAFAQLLGLYRLLQDDLASSGATYGNNRQAKEQSLKKVGEKLESYSLKLSEQFQRTKDLVNALSSKLGILPSSFSISGHQQLENSIQADLDEAFEKIEAIREKLAANSFSVQAKKENEQDRKKLEKELDGIEDYLSLIQSHLNSGKSIAEGTLESTRFEINRRLVNISDLAASMGDQIVDYTNQATYAIRNMYSDLPVWNSSIALKKCMIQSCGYPQKQAEPIPCPSSFNGEPWSAVVERLTKKAEAAFEVYSDPKKTGGGRINKTRTIGVAEFITPLTGSFIFANSGANAATLIEQHQTEVVEKPITHPDEDNPPREWSFPRHSEEDPEKWKGRDYDAERKIMEHVAYLAVAKMNKTGTIRSELPIRMAVFVTSDIARTREVCSECRKTIPLFKHVLPNALIYFTDRTGTCY